MWNLRNQNHIVAEAVGAGSSGVSSGCVGGTFAAINKAWPC